MCRWNAGERVTAVAHDNPVPGFQTSNTINLRLWSAKPDKEFDLEAFNTGDYVQVPLFGNVLFLLPFNTGGHLSSLSCS